MLKKILLAVIALALVAVVVFQFAFVEIPVAAMDIPIGTYLKASDIKMSRVLFSDVPANAMKDSASIVGQMTKSTIVQDGVFMPYLLETTTANPGGSGLVIEKDDVLVALIVKAENIPTSLRVGDNVKMVAYFGTGEATLKPAFVHSFPHLAVIQNIKKDENGIVVGVDVITHHSIGTELALSSLQGTVSLLQVNPEATPDTIGSNVDGLFEKYFYGPQINQ